MPTWLKNLKKYKFSPNIIKQEIIQKYDTNFIEATLKHCEKYFKQANIPNKEGFLLKALEKGYYKDLIVQATHNNKKRKEENISKKSDEDYKAAYQSYLNTEAENALNNLQPQKIEELKKAFLSNIETNNFFKTAVEAYGFEHKVIQGQWKIFLRDELLTEEQRSEQLFRKNQLERNQNN